MGRIVYFIREALRGFYQAKLMTFIAIVAVAVSLFFIAAVGVLIFNVQQLFTNALEQVDIIVYLEDGAVSDSATLNQMISRFYAFPQVDSIVYIDKELAWQTFEEQYGSEMLDAIDDNPLPASFNVLVKAQYHQSIPQLAKELERMNGVESVNYSPEWMARVKQFMGYLFIGILVIVVMCILVLQFIVSNTIKLTIYARKDLVSNMRYVGATDAYIATPFILEGMLQGFLGGLVAFSALMVTHVALQDFVSFGQIKYHVAIIAIGTLFGWSGSWSAVRKFLV